uniref:Large ribosomal subunit protein uL15 n=1 Tax=Ditylenchus dipsaci TaxID=166011 RepID=A0A915DY82_9BILA
MLPALGLNVVNVVRAGYHKVLGKGPLVKWFAASPHIYGYDKKEDEKASWSRFAWSWNASTESILVGMRNFHVRKNLYYSPTINLDKIWSLVTEETRKKYADVTNEAPVINVVRAGYHKVLGKGLLPKQPVIVKRNYTAHAALVDENKEVDEIDAVQLRMKTAWMSMIVFGAPNRKLPSAQCLILEVVSKRN